MTGVCLPPCSTYSRTVTRSIRASASDSGFTNNGSKSHEQTAALGTFPPAQQNGGLVTTDNGHYTTYSHDGKRYQADSDAWRQRSLPFANKVQAQSKPRKISSAPSKKLHRGDRLAPLPVINNLVSRGKQQPPSNIPATIMTGDRAGGRAGFAGKTSGMITDVNGRGNTKFATSWANARAENIHTSNEHSRVAVANLDDTRHEPKTKSVIKQKSTASCADNGGDSKINENKEKRNDATKSNKSEIRTEIVKSVHIDATDDKNDTMNKNLTNQKLKSNLKSEDQHTKTASGFLQTDVSKFESANPKFPITTKNTHTRDDHDIEKHTPTKISFAKTTSESTKKDPKPPATVNRIKKANQYKPEHSFSYIGPKTTGQKQYSAAETKAYFDQVREGIKHPDPSISVKNRKELTHRPSTLQPREVYQVYTSAYNPLSRSRSKQVRRSQSQSNILSESESRRKSVYSGGSDRRDVVLNRREVVRYRAMHSVYNSDTVKRKRQDTFYKKLEDMQIKENKSQIRLQRERKIIHQRSKQRQQRQLKRVRNRYYNDTMHRFKTQHVTSRIVEKVYREELGLPDQVDDHKKVPIVNPKKVPVKIVNPAKQRQTNFKRFGKMFNAKVGPSWDPMAKTPKMEGVDVLYLPQRDVNGKVKEKRMEVKDLIQEAKSNLQTTSKVIADPISPVRSKAQSPLRLNTTVSPAPEVDMFELARRKYGLDLSDSESDT